MNQFALGGIKPEPQLDHLQDTPYAHPLFELALAVILEDGGRSLGKAYALPLA